MSLYILLNNCYTTCEFVGCAENAILHFINHYPVGVVIIINIIILYRSSAVLLLIFFSFDKKYNNNDEYKFFFTDMKINLSQNTDF